MILNLVGCCGGSPAEPSTTDFKPKGKPQFFVQVPGAQLAILADHSRALLNSRFSLFLLRDLP